MLTSLDFLNIGQAWPPVSELQRLNEYEDNRLLFEGDHPAVFNDWYRVLRKDQRASLEFVLALFKRLSTLWGDLLLGEVPRFTAGKDDSPEQRELDRIITENELAITAYEVALDQSRYGDGLFRLRLEERQTIIEAQPPTVWFPVVHRHNVRKVQAHVLAWTFQVPQAGRESSTYLRAEIHTPGKIERRMFLLTDSRIVEEVDGAQFEDGWLPVEETKVEGMLVVPVNGLRTSDRYHGLDDYTDIISLVQEMEVRVAQISRILDKHSDPSMWGPQEALKTNPKTGEEEFVAGGEYFPTVDGQGQPAGYIVWDGQLTNAFQELDRLIQQFYIVSETSPAVFGRLEQGQAESGSALRRLMLAPLAKVNRVRLRFDPRLKELIERASELEHNNGRAETPILSDVHIEWRDGVPDDPMEAATIESTRLGAGASSLYNSLKRMDGGTDKSIQEEIDRIREDQASEAGAQPAGIPGLNLRFNAQQGQAE